MVVERHTKVIIVPGGSIHTIINSSGGLHGCELRGSQIAQADNVRGTHTPFPGLRTEGIDRMGLCTGERAIRGTRARQFGHK